MRKFRAAIDRRKAVPLPQATQSLCPQCQTVVQAELYVHDGDVWIRQTCDVHGVHEALHFKNAALYRSMSDVVGHYQFCQTYECLDGVHCERCLDKTYTIMVEVTNKCNLDCPTCCSDANHPYSQDPSIEQVLQRLPPVAPGVLGRLRRPNIVLFGGEPTVRKDLPQIIEAMVQRGYVPRLATNGVRMTDRKYLQTLWDVGLRWVILQFDGFDDEVSVRLRGEALHQKKLDAIAMLSEFGFKVQLGTMMVKSINTKYIDDIIRFVGQHDKLFWMSFYPVAEQSRFDPEMQDFHTAEIFDEIKTETEGRILPEDFVTTMRWLGRLNRWLRLPNLKQKLSTASMILVVDDDDYYPAVRLLRPGFAVQHLPMLLRMLGAVPKVLWYQSAYTPPFLKFLVVERFHTDHAIDLAEASNCHMSFMTTWGFPPFDLYNIAAKKRGPWAEHPIETAAFVPVQEIKAAPTSNEKVDH